jgi:hypothetical protein
MSDQQQWATIAGRSQCRTPHLNRLAQDGMLFEPSYTPSAVCCPARAMLLSGVRIDAGFRADLIVEDKVIVEIKSVEAPAPVHTKQLLTYLKLADKRLGLLINFHVALIKDARPQRRVIARHTAYRRAVRHRETSRPQWENSRR